MLPEAAQEMLTSYSQQLVQRSSPEVLARVIEAPLTALATERSDRQFQPLAELQTFQRWLRPTDVVSVSTFLLFAPWADRNAGDTICAHQ